MSTSLKQFNTTLKEFLSKLITIFPSTKTEILKHYRPLLEGDDYDELQYWKEFTTHATQYQHNIANKEEEIFRHPICLFPGIDFQLIWNSEFNTPKTKKSIWIYLSVFFSLGQRIQNEQSKKEASLEHMTDEDKLLNNLQEAKQEYTNHKLTSKEQFIQTLTDKELMRELERRKEDRAERKANADDEEDLLNFNPDQGYSIWNAIKGMSGGAGGAGGMLGNMGNIGGIIDMISKTFGIDVSNFDMNNFDISNIGNMVKDLVTPENIEKVKEQITKFASEFQQDLDTGNIDKSELMNMFNTVKDNFQNMANSDEKTEGDGEGGDMMENLMKQSQKMFSNMVPANMREQFEQMQKQVMKDPSKLAEYMSNPEALMKQMAGGNKAAVNRFNNNNRNEQARNRLAKKFEDKQKLLAEQQKVEEDINNLPSSSDTLTQKKKKKKKKKKNNNTFAQPMDNDSDLTNLDVDNLDDVDELDLDLDLEVDDLDL